MSGKDIIGSFTGFLGKYAGELGGIVTVLDKLVNTVPILKEEKLGIRNVLDTLSENVNSLNDFVENHAQNLQPVVIRQSDIDDAIARYMEKKSMEGATSIKANAEG